MSSLWAWVGFSVFIVAMLGIDLGVLNRKAHVIRLREAAMFTALVVTCAGVFNGWIFVSQGSQPGLEFLTGYLIELALSVDNIFVFILVFSYFQVPAQYQHRVLFWGIIGALAMRGGMIAAGWLLVERFHWIIYIFGAFLVYTGIRMATHDEVDIKIEANPVMRLIRRFMAVSPTYDGQRFFTKQTVAGQARWLATPLFVVLIMVDVVDLIFAVDSIPAIFAVTADPFIIFTSNVFAILGLRSMYFLLAGIIEKFHYLKLGLAAVLTFVGAKMLVTYFEIEIPISISLGVVGGVLGLSVLASLLFPKNEPNPLMPHEESSTAAQHKEHGPGGPAD